MRRWHDWQHRRADRRARGGRLPSLEVHIPISPNEHFFGMTETLVRSLRRFGGPYQHARVVVTVGEDCEPFDLWRAQPWSRRLNVDWRWVDRALFREHSYAATALERFRYPFAADMVLILDADVLVAAPFDDAVSVSWREQRLRGLIAHVAPFAREEDWQAIFDSAGLPMPEFSHQHTGWGCMSACSVREAPAYFNFGVLMAPAEVMRRIGETIYSEMEAVNRVLETPYRCQLALTLAVTRLSLPVRPLAMRYNFPNDGEIEAGYTGELRDIRLLHYLRRNEQVDKFRDFCGRAAMRRLYEGRQLDGANGVLGQRLRALYG